MKTAIKVNKNLMQQSLQNVEANGPLKNRSVLWEEVVKEYNKNISRNEPPITTSLVMLRVKEWNLTVKTAANKGKSSKEVDKDVLVTSIQEAEKDGPLANQSKLWQRVAEIYNGKTNDPISPSVVMLRVTNWQIPILTPLGKVRKDKEDVISTIVRELNKKPSRAEKKKARVRIISDDPQVQRCVQEMADELERNDALRFLPIIERIAKGSRKAAVQFHCLDCCGYSTVEVKNCRDFSCGMWLFRPYQRSTEEELDAEQSDDETSVAQEEVA